MTVTIDTTVGGASTNSYVDVTTATTYLGARLNASAWTTASTDDQAAALVEAFRSLNQLLYSGNRAADIQAAQWPRWYATNPDATAFSWQYYDSTIIPQRMKDAQCELALEFLRAGTTDIASQDSTVGIIEKTVDVLTTRYADPYQRPQGLARFPRVMGLISPLLASSSNSGRVVHG